MQTQNSNWKSFLYQTHRLYKLGLEQNSVSPWNRAQFPLRQLSEVTGFLCYFKSLMNSVRTKPLHCLAFSFLEVLEISSRAVRMPDNVLPLNSSLAIFLIFLVYYFQHSASALGLLVTARELPVQLQEPQ